MIVNTAYIYMGVGGGGGGGGGGDTPANPNLWQDGVANYPVEFTNNSSISSEYLDLTRGGGSAAFSELLLTDFNNLTITVYQGGNMYSNIVIKFEFLNSSGQLLGTETAKFTYGPTFTTPPKTVNIPSAAKIQNAKIRMKNSSSKDVKFASAVLS